MPLNRHCNEQFQAAIFDLDGTLADTLEDIADNMNHVLAQAGYPAHEYDAYRFYVGDGLRNLAARCLPEDARADDIVNLCFDRMMERYHKNYIIKSRLYDGVPELLDALSQQGVKLAVLSNKADSLTQKICAKLLSRWKFEQILGATDRFPRKPDPAAALELCRLMGVAPERVCYVGDSDVDMKTAIAAGFYPAGAGWGYRPKEELLASGAMLVADSARQLHEIHFMQ